MFYPSIHSNKSLKVDPYLYLVHVQLEKFLKQLMGKLLMLDAIKLADHLTEVDIEKYKHKSFMLLALSQRANCINYSMMMMSAKINRGSF